MENQIAVAMRVIQSAAIRESAPPEDVALLRAEAAPENRHRDPYELACLVIEAELLRPKNGRAT
jgi:hypothetical protein